MKCLMFHCSSPFGDSKYFSTFLLESATILVWNAFRLLLVLRRRRKRRRSFPSEHHEKRDYHSKSQCPAITLPATKPISTTCEQKAFEALQIYFVDAKLNSSFFLEERDRDRDRRGETRRPS